MIHRLQAYQKFGDKIYEKGIVVRHLNGDRYDNSYDNIGIGTIIDNKNDIPKELISINCGQIKRKYSKEIVENIRKDYENGLSYSSIMTKYHITSKRHNTLYNT